MTMPSTTSGYAISGYITRNSLIPSLPNLPIFVDPYWPILGDTSEAADASMHSGLDPKQSVTKQVWADSPFVAGKQLVLSTPDNSTLDLRLVINGSSMLDAQAKIAPIVRAIRNQLTFQVAVTLDTATYAWNCYSGDYVIAFNQLHVFGYLVPMYVTMPRDPTPALGPIT